MTFENITAFTTTVGLLGIWDSFALKFIKTTQLYNDNFVSDVTILKLMHGGKCVIWSTNKGGEFNIEVRLNEQLSKNENTMITSESLNNKLIVTEGGIYAGSPEFAGINEEEASKKDLIRKINIDKGFYIVNVYNLFDYSYIEKAVTPNESDKTAFVVTINKTDENFSFNTKWKLFYAS